MNLLNLLFVTTFCLSEIRCSNHNRLTEVIQLEQGPVKGLRQEVGGGTVQMFLGLPYGKANRFEKPKLTTEHWSQVRDAVNFGPGCVQFGLSSTTLASSYSEDCLYLNVIRPDGNVSSLNSSNLSVMVWIHGGSFKKGTTSTRVYDGHALVLTGHVIVVTLNYRLGPLGFLNDGTEHVPGNQALHDQIVALTWVRHNIRHFGGNPSDVTIFGQSAGSVLVSLLMVSPMAKGLFTRAILQSGSALGLTKTSESSLEDSRRFAQKANCGGHKLNWVNCLRNRSVAELQRAAKALSGDHDWLTFAPMYGDSLLPIRPWTAMQTGQFYSADVDLMFGVTRDEGTKSVARSIANFNEATIDATSARRAMLQVLSKQFALPYGDEVADYYLARTPSNTSSDQYKTLIGRMVGDFMLVCPTIWFAQEFARAKSADDHRNDLKTKPVNVYGYRLMQEGLTTPADSRAPNKWQGVTHSQDLMYLFMPQVVQSVPALAQLSTEMLRAWTSFARTGAPGVMADTQWERAFDGDGNSDSTLRYMHLENDHFRMVDNDHFHQACDSLWNRKLLLDINE